MDRELFRNGSGYADPTAYNAMITVEEEKMQTKPFEIWKYEVGANEKMGIVMAQEDGVVTVLPLFERPVQNGIEFSMIQGIRSVHPARLSYVMESKLIGYVQDIPAALADDLSNSFQMTFWDIIPKSENDIPAENVPFVEPKGISDIQLQLEGERREKEVYKGLYEGLLDKLIK